MKKLLILTAALTVHSASPALAALAPYWDSVVKLETVLKSELVAKKFFGAIVQIKSLGNNEYQLSSDFCDGKVTLEAHVPNRPGATSYTVSSVESVCE